MTHDVPSPLPTFNLPPLVSAKELADQLHIGVRKAREVMRHRYGHGTRLLGDRTERWPLSYAQALVAQEFSPESEKEPA